MMFGDSHQTARSTRLFRQGLSRLLILLPFAWLVGCASRPFPPSPRAFEFSRDAFAFTNELHWVYQVDPATGRQVHVPRDPPPRYALRCFVLARGARQFLWHARFDPTLPALDDGEYRRRVREVMRRDSRRPTEGKDPVILPGYPDLHAFTLARPDLVKEACGGPRESYWQRGHWRMVFPFSRRSQDHSATRFAGEIQRREYPVVHLVRFPQLTINHAVLLYEAREQGDEIRFLAYDPNSPSTPLELRFDRGSRRFELSPSAYFAGGRVDVYEVYRGACY